MLPFSIESRNEVVRLYWLKGSSKFQTIQDGEIGPVMIGHEYVVFSNNTADWFKSLDLEGVRFEPTIVWNRKQETDYSEYQKAIIYNHFTSENINDTNISGRRFLVMENQYLFATVSE